MTLQAKYTDTLGNTDTIRIVGDKIRMFNQHGIAMSLANIQHLFTDRHPEIHTTGTAGTRSIIAQVIRESIRQTKTNAEFAAKLNLATGRAHFEAA